MTQKGMVVFWFQKPLAIPMHLIIESKAKKNCTIEFPWKTNKFSLNCGAVTNKFALNCGAVEC